LRSASCCDPGLDFGSSTLKSRRSVAFGLITLSTLLSHSSHARETFILTEADIALCQLLWQFDSHTAPPKLAAHVPRQLENSKHVSERPTRVVKYDHRPIY